MALHQNNNDALKLPERMYVDGMALKDPHSRRNNLLLLGAAVVCICIYKMAKSRKAIHGI
jgi:hypothetical protein